MNPRLATVLALVPFALLAACSAAEDADASSADVTAGDTGSIAVALPANLSTAHLDNGVVLVDNKPIKANATTDGLAVGPHTVNVNGCTTQVNVTSKQTSTVTLGALQYTLPKEPTLGLNATLVTAPASTGAHPTHAPMTEAFHFDECSDPQTTPADGQLYASLPGTFTASWGYRDGVAAVQVAASAATPLDLGAPAGRQLVRIHAPATRTEPTAGEKDPTQGVTTWAISGSAAPGVMVATTPGMSLIVGTRVVAAGSPAFVTLTLQLPFTTARALPLTKGTLSELAIGRVEVADISVAATDGTSHATPGFWSLQAQDSTVHVNLVGVDGPHGAKTNHGVDVWPGTYDVSTAYDAGGGNWQTATHSVSE